MKSINCHDCAGHGQVADYGNGEDFYGAKECTTCNGSGKLLITPKGALVVYPGGPFRGRLTKQEMNQNASR